jgi:hypothetical protein
MLILENIFQYSFIFSVKCFFVEKNNFPKISALFFWNYFMPNLLVGYGIVPLTGFSLNPDSLDWQIMGSPPHPNLITAPNLSIIVIGPKFGAVITLGWEDSRTHWKVWIWWKLVLWWFCFGANALFWRYDDKQVSLKGGQHNMLKFGNWSRRVL